MVVGTYHSFVEVWTITNRTSVDLLRILSILGSSGSGGIVRDVNAGGLLVMRCWY